MLLKQFLTNTHSQNIFLASLMCFVLSYNFLGAQTVTYNFGAGNFTVPDGIDTIKVSVWGAGGGGGFNNGNKGAAGGGGGAFILANIYIVTPGGAIAYMVGSGGIGQTSASPVSFSAGNGNPSVFGPTGPKQLYANGGSRGRDVIFGTGGLPSIGPYFYRGGGNSATPSNSGNSDGSGGGAAGSSSGAGANGTSTGLRGVGSNGAGSGGDGGGYNNDTEVGKNGTQPGGGGGGEGQSGASGGNGGDGRITIAWICSNTLPASTANQTLCAGGPAITNITYTMRGAYGATFSNLPPGVTGAYTNGLVTISGTPTAAAAGNSYNYTVTPTGSCISAIATGTITVTGNNTAGTISSNTFCQGSALPAGVTQSTSGATGIGTPTGLPNGVTAAWAGNQITFTGTPTVFGSFPYSIPLTGGCGSVNATGTITINETPSIKSFTSPGGTQCINTDFPDLSVGTGFGYTYQWYKNAAPNNTTGTAIIGETNNTLDPSRTPAGTTYYYVVVSSPTCTSSVTSPVLGAYTVAPNNTVTAASATPIVCIGSPMPTPVTHTTTGATAIGAATGLPTGVTATFSSNTITISGTPSVSGVFSYTIPLSGGCGTVNATGTITVNATSAITSPVLTGQTRCINTTAFNPLSVGGGQGFTYQWYRNTANSNVGGTSIPGATTNSYTPANNTAGTLYYYVVVSSATSCSTAVTSAVSGAIIVNPLPVVSFTAQPSGPTACVDTDVTYSTQIGETAYVWTIPGTTGVDYSITSGGNGSPNLVLKWLTPGNKSVTVNYTDAQGCGASSPATSNTITVQKTIATPPSNPNSSSCYTGAFTSITHSTTFATGITNPGVSGANGLPLGLSAIWTGTAANGTISISGTVDPTVTPGPKSYSIPLNGGCGTVVATGVINVEPQYTIGQIFSVSPSSTGGNATITLNLVPSTLANGSFVVNYSMGGANPRAATNLTVNFINGVGTFPTSSITNEDLTSLTINSVRKASDPTSCPVPTSTNNITFFGIQPKIFPSNGTFYVPAGIFQITVKVYGGGGGGGGGSKENSAGGGGGGYSENTISVTPGEAIGIFIGIGGPGQTGSGTAGNGGPSWITRDSSLPNPQTSSLAYAFGGGGANVTTRGAAALTGLNGSINQPGNIGGLPNVPTADTGGTGGKGGGPDGGNGGLGGAGNGNRPGNTGSLFGGGGGGSRGNADGGNGARGYVIITYPLPPQSSCFEVIDDGAKSGTTVIEFTCLATWTAPEGLTRFNTTVGGAGGGGGLGSGGGGGGAGELVHNLSYSTTNPYGFPAGTSFSITVGQGGAGSTSINSKGNPGGTSTITGNIDGSAITGAIAIGGGGGGSRGNGTGMDGTSGGGGAAIDSPQTNFIGGKATTPSKGTSGGRGDASGNGAHAGGGGGGITTIGQNGSGAGAGQGKGGDGGNGVQYIIAGSTRNYGGGGGGIGNNFNGINKFNGVGGSVAGIKIGGDGNQDNASSVGYQGQDLTGSGGGAGFLRGGRGGNGVVYIYYDNFRILEVEYLYFNAKYNPQTRSADLAWATSKEWENLGFEIERSVNGVTSWTKIGELEGKGYSEVPSDYRFSDLTLPASGGIVYYRLKQVDFNGKFSYSVTKSLKVEGVKGSGAWIAYPNPSSLKSKVTLDLLNRSVYNDELILVQISDIKGIAETFTVHQIESVSEVVNAYLDRSISGMYVIQIIWGNKSEQIKLLRN
ncbi:hypothetical protein LV84_02792 [Algoriphagus ratkowskyi]|uniref:Glycine-rich domain-containing protein n=1 Tax=Algoriphagus ratkowskyi TaxID=57028 RepID=A0A2W7RJH9_9BACT|nr:hypothetical protein [Algoriphagus ratkowskyi]PZX54639.1 hypothetical protein LV84_02792 [Algoriphagus ratkowskyi]TXD76950.1 hypothetical protein ESW18_14175 [Algoriphagus ratkowskyi]